MSSAYDPISFNGTNIGPGTDYEAVIPYQEENVVESSIETISSMFKDPVVFASFREGRSVPLEIRKASGSVLTDSEFRSDVRSLFAVHENKNARYLVFYGEDGATSVRLPTYVRRIASGGVNSNTFNIELYSPQTYLEANSESSDSSSPVTVGGEIPTPATLEFTCSTHKQVRQSTVGGSLAGGGAVGYPVKLSYTQASLTAGEVIPYVNGVPVPTLSDDYAAYVWCLVDLCADSNITTPIYLVTADGIDDSFEGGGRLEDCGMKLADATSGTDSTNTSWTWNDWPVGSNPDRCGAWRPNIVGNQASENSYRITSDGSSVTISLSKGEEKTADSISVVLGCTGNTLATFRRVFTLSSGGYGNQSAFIIGRSYSATTWSSLWSVTSTGTVTTNVNCSGMTELACGLQDTEGGIVGTATLVIDGAGSGSGATLSLANTPTVNIGAAEDLDYYNGSIENDETGETITFESVLVAGGTLIFDTKNRRWESSAGYVPILGKISWSNDEEPFNLIPGDNVISVTGMSGASWTAKWRDAYP